MRAVVFHRVGDIRLEKVRDPKLEAPTDAIVKLTASAICGTDLHLVRGSLPGVEPGTVLGHEGIGVVQETGPQVRNFKRGDRVVISPTIACGSCAYCRAGYTSQCDRSNPNGPKAGPAVFGGPRRSGPFHGLQAEYARIPYAHVTLTRLPDEVTDGDAILLSDIAPTAYFAAKLAEIRHGDTVAVFGCGPVGLMSLWAAFHLGAGRVIAVDRHAHRLAAAREQGAEVIDFDHESPVEAILQLTQGIGVDRAIDAVGCDAQHAHAGPAAKLDRAQRKRFEQERDELAPVQHPHGDHWHVGEAPSQALAWAVEALAKAGTLSVVGLYGEAARHFPIGAALHKNLTLNGGHCNHKKYLGPLLELVREGALRPSQLLHQRASFSAAIEAYRELDLRTPGWTQVELRVAA